MRSLYAADIASFLAAPIEHVLGALSARTGFEIVVEARNAWTTQVAVLQQALSEFAGRGQVYLEFPIPRLGKWVDAVVVLDHVVFVIEFKVGETAFRGADRDQVWDYALDLRNFHDTSHTVPIAPMLVATRAFAPTLDVVFHTLDDRMALPMAVGAEQLREGIEQMLMQLSGPRVDAAAWERGRYQPTPTIIEAARALYANHSVAAISRSDAGAKNLQRTAQIVDTVISDAQRDRRKCICFVTGVPGAGKTLVGLDVATRHRDAESALHSVFLSGNGPLVSVLREALARDHVARNSTPEHRVRKGDARRIVNAFIQPVHHFRDAYLADPNAPADHVVLFDEAQRAWDMKQTSDFMRRKKNQPDFAQSEPEFLIACMDRHTDWAVVVCLVGGGQEINTGEAGVSEWFDALGRRFPAWQVHLSPQLLGSEYRAEAAIAKLRETNMVIDHEDLHLSTSMRSYRAERLSEFVRLVIDREVAQARKTLESFSTRYPIMVTRDLARAKAWLRAQARGGERYGMVVSSQAQRLKPLAIDVRPKVDPVHWFLHEKDDVRSSYALEDVGTEFQVQGLELDWTCVVWDADLRHTNEGWRHHEFVGTRWNRIQQARAQRYLENAYRVLLTRARQGMVIVVPQGNADDPTRDPSLYDQTFQYLQSVGITSLD